MNDDKANRLSIQGFDYNLHSKHGRATYVRSAEVTSPKQLTLSPTSTAMLYESAPMSTNLQVRHGSVLYPYQCSHTPLLWSETSVVITPTGDTQSQSRTVTSYKTGHRATIFTSSMTPNSEAPFRSAQWNCEYSPDLCWISTVGCHPQPTSCTVPDDFPHSQHRASVIHIGLQLPIIRGIKKR
jgi:hypothetical protein